MINTWNRTNSEYLHSSSIFFQKSMCKSVRRRWNDLPMFFWILFFLSASNFHTEKNLVKRTAMRSCLLKKRTVMRRGILKEYRLTNGLLRHFQNLMLLPIHYLLISPRSYSSWKVNIFYLTFQAQFYNRCSNTSGCSCCLGENSIYPAITTCTPECNCSCFDVFVHSCKSISWCSERPPTNAAAVWWCTVMIWTLSLMLLDLWHMMDTITEQNSRVNELKITDFLENQISLVGDFPLHLYRVRYVCTCCTNLLIPPDLRDWNMLLSRKVGTAVASEGLRMLVFSGAVLVHVKPLQYCK